MWYYGVFVKYMPCLLCARPITQDTLLILLYVIYGGSCALSLLPFSLLSYLVCILVKMRSVEWQAVLLLGDYLLFVKQIKITSFVLER